jgi:GTP-binding protein Era
MEDRVFHCGYVALVGEPNAGKSTLMNHLVDSRLAIVTPKPQTTRRRTLGIVSGEGYQMVLLDTPGIMKPHDPLQVAMMRTVDEVLGDADVACAIIDAHRLKPGELTIPETLRRFPGARIAALNKIDRVNPKDLLIPLIQEIAGTQLFAEIVPISALTGDGVDRLLQVLVRALPAAPPFYPTDQLTEQPERFFVGELVREQILVRYAEEVPYAVEVEVEEFTEREGAKDFIRIILHVEQESQKGILIGRGGHAIKELGAAARVAIEQFLGRPVYLELRVKVSPKWRRDAATLRRLGYRT